MKHRSIVMGILLVLTAALATGSVLLLGYITAAASFLVIIGLLVRRARRTLPSIHSSPAPSFDVEDREAA
ncbi:MAG: hypothetical protein ABI885_28925 [Gammaproteobacteria bacterium]